VEIVPVGLHIEKHVKVKQTS